MGSGGAVETFAGHLRTSLIKVGSWKGTWSI